jgi:hypothetical protein
VNYLEWQAIPKTLGYYLTKTEVEWNGGEQDKVCYDGVEFYPALPDEDPRTPNE